MAAYFPAQHSVEDIGINSMMYNYVLALLDSAEGIEGADEKLKEALEALEENQKPLILSPHRPENVLTQMEVSTEKLLLSLEESGYVNARTMSVFSVETAIIRNQEAIKKLLKNGQTESE